MEASADRGRRQDETCFAAPVDRKIRDGWKVSPPMSTDKNAKHKIKLLQELVSKVIVEEADLEVVLCRSICL
jgi:hypothetical protein